jgi:hypothetical protein
MKITAEHLRRVTGTREQRLLWLLLLLTFLKGWLWAAAFPPMMHADELQHLGYARDVFRSGTLYIEPRGYFTPEEVIADQIVQVSAVSGLRRPVNLSPERQAERTQLRQLLQDPSQQPPPEAIVFGPYFARHHPPLYYGVESLLARLVKPVDMFADLAWGRLLSVLLTVAGVGFTYLLAQEVVPERPLFALAAATMMSFWPMITYIGAVFSNQALEIPLFAAIFWLLARIIRRGVTWPLALWLGLGLGLGLLTKVSLLVTVPLILFVAVYDGWRRRTFPLAWSLIVFLPLLIAGPWYFDYVQGSSGTVAGSADVALGCPNLTVYLTELPWGAVGRRMWRESVTAFGLSDSLFPTWVYYLSEIGLLLAVAGWGRRLVGGLTNRGDGWRWPRERWLMVGMLFLAWVGIHAFVLLIGYLLSCEQVDAYAAASSVTRNPLAFAIGRLVIPGAAAPLSLLLLLGWETLTRRHWRGIFLAAGFLIIALNSYALIDRVLGRYYGLQEIWVEEQRQVNSSSLTPDHTVQQCITLPPMKLARVDVWLNKAQNNVTGNLQLQIVTAEGEMIGQTEAFSLGGLATYPAYAQFPPQTVSGDICLLLSGEFASPVQVWATDSSAGNIWYDGAAAKEGNLALRLYGTVPWSTMPERLAAASVNVYSATFYRLLGLLYILTLLVFIGGYLAILTAPLGLSQNDE